MGLFKKEKTTPAKPMNGVKPSAKAEALYELGCDYLNGNGVEKDQEKADNYFIDAIELGHANAAWMVLIGYLTRELDEDETGLKEYLVGQILTLGSADDLFFWAGQTIQFDLDTANKFMRKSADLGNEGAKAYLRG